MLLTDIRNSGRHYSRPLWLGLYAFVYIKDTVNLYLVG
jgi:hypothetical protein